MEKYLIILLCLLLFISGCQGSSKDKIILAKINDYEITKEEFEEEFKVSPFGRTDTLESRKEFLKHLINRKLILQEAQAQGLDKKKSFLKLIERFWEQSLLKIALDRKSKEIVGSVQVSDGTIEETYKNMLKEGETEKPYEEMYKEIKWRIIKLKESQMMNGWLEGLRKDADIQIDYGLLEADK